MKTATMRLAWPVLLLCLCWAPAAAKEYWNYDTARESYDRGVKRDDVQAYKWFSLAVALIRNDGHRAVARNRRDGLATRLTRTQLATARERVCDWWRRHGKGSVKARSPLAGCVMD